MVCVSARRESLGDLGECSELSGQVRLSSVQQEEFQHVQPGQSVQPVWQPQVKVRRASSSSRLEIQTFLSSMCGEALRAVAGTPPATPSSLLQQTFNNVVSAATSFSAATSYRNLGRQQDQ